MGSCCCFASCALVRGFPVGVPAKMSHWARQRVSASRPLALSIGPPHVQSGAQVFTLSRHDSSAHSIRECIPPFESHMLHVTHLCPHSVHACILLQASMSAISKLCAAWLLKGRYSPPVLVSLQWSRRSPMHRSSFSFPLQLSNQSRAPLSRHRLTCYDSSPHKGARFFHEICVWTGAIFTDLVTSPCRSSPSFGSGMRGVIQGVAARCKLRCSMRHPDSGHVAAEEQQPSSCHTPRRNHCPEDG